MKSTPVLAAFAVLMFALSADGMAQQPKAGEIRRAKIVKLDVPKYAITLNMSGKDLDLVLAEETQVLAASGRSLKERMADFKVGAEVQFVSRIQDGKHRVTHIRLFEGNRATPIKADLSKLTPLNEMGDMKYQGYQGGFYPDGKNVRPKTHEDAGQRLAKEVQPRDAQGKPNTEGKVVLMSVGMSNTAQASQGFQKALAAFPDRNQALVFVSGAQGGMTAARIQNPENADGTKYWSVVDQQLQKAGVTREQVQVVWIKQADAGPSSGFPRYAKTLETELANIVRILPRRFPNIKMVYLSSRTFGGYAKSPLNPEPYAFESAFSVKWLIEKQIQGDADLSYDTKNGPAKAPWLSWGPYLWAKGSTKRTDGFHYAESDFTPNDGTHLSPTGIEKVGRHMLQFFQNDTTSRPWFVAAKKH